MHRDYCNKPKELKYVVRIEAAQPDGSQLTISKDNINTLDDVGDFIKKQLSSIDQDLDATIYVNYEMK